MTDDVRRHARLALAAVVGLAGVSLACEFLIWPDWDATWLLAAARMIRGGATPYSQDLIEVNPPTIIEIARLALALGDRLGVTAITAWRLLVFATELLSLLLSTQLLRRMLSGEDRVCLLPAAVALVTALACLPGANFGQREHFILVLCAPYVLASALYIDGERLSPVVRILYGLLLAIGLSIKPHYILLVACVEAGVVYSTRRPRGWLRIETVSAVASGMVLALVLLARYPTYLTFAVPYALRFYHDYDRLQLVPAHAAYLGFGLASVFALHALRLRSSGPRSLVLAGVGAYLALVAQGKGWDYHFVPARSLLFLGGALACLLVANARATPWLARTVAMPSRRAALLVTVAMVLPLTVLMARRTVNINRGHWADQFSALQTVIERAQPNGRPFTMATVSLELFPAFPVVEVMGGAWASRYSCLWTIPAIEARERDGRDDGTPDRSGRQGLIAAVSEDLANNRPTFVLVEEARSRLIDDIVSAPRVRDVLRAYHLAARVGAIAVWVRNDSDQD